MANTKEKEKKNTPLATFRCDKELWDEFRAKAEESGTNASALLLEFVKSYVDPTRSSLNVDDSSINVKIPDSLSKRISEHLAPIKEQLAALQSELDALKPPPPKSKRGKTTNLSPVATAPAKTTNPIPNSELTRPDHCPNPDCNASGENLRVHQRFPNGDVSWKCKVCNRNSKFDYSTEPPTYTAPNRRRIKTDN